MGSLEDSLRALEEQRPAENLDEQWPIRTDLPLLLQAGIPEPLFIDPDRLLPEASRVLAVGPAESGKSLWAAWIASRLTREGLEVTYLSQENPLPEDVRRWGRLRPDYDRLHFYHGQSFDLAVPDHVDKITTIAAKSSLIVIDTLSAAWSGDENSNKEIAELDRIALGPLSRDGSTVLLLDHTGHPSQFVTRKGVSAARGASSKGQKVDTLLEFVPQGPSSFRIEPGKMRAGGVLPAPMSCQVVDTDDDGLDIQIDRNAPESRVMDCASRIVALVSGSEDPLPTKSVRAAVSGFGQEIVSQAIDLLLYEQPPRVRRYDGKTRKGQRAKLWAPAWKEEKLDVG
jgi:hypothetical protein